MVISAGVSTSKAAKLCQQLFNDGVEISTPTQAAIYKATFREAEKVKKRLKESLRNENWCLHFDGKRLEDNEYQVVVLSNTRTVINLDAIQLANGKAETIAHGIAKVLDEFGLYSSIKMIISDTTSVNTGKKSGVVIRLQQLFEEKGAEKPMFIGCQHHILDRILRLVMDQELGENNTSPNIHYPFVLELIKKFDYLTGQFENGKEEILTAGGWRDDMKYLFHLCKVFNFFDVKRHFPKVVFQKIPNISNARWNSRAILVLLAFILIPTSRDTLYNVCRFIARDWSSYWFHDQTFNETHFGMLSAALKPYNKALKSLQTFWCRDPSLIPVPRSNQCAERGIKKMQKLHDICKNKKKLSLRFILSNQI